MKYQAQFSKLAIFQKFYFFGWFEFIKQGGTPCVWICTYNWLIWTENPINSTTKSPVIKIRSYFASPCCIDGTLTNQIWIFQISHEIRKFENVIMPKFRVGNSFRKKWINYNGQAIGLQKSRCHFWVRPNYPSPQVIKTWNNQTSRKCWLWTD